MNEMAEECEKHRRSPPASSSLMSPRCCKSTQTRLPVESPMQPRRMNNCPMEQDEDSGDHQVVTQSSALPSSSFYEELFCTRQTPVPLAPLASALMPSSWPQSDVVRQGYLGKLERNHRRYFVLRAVSHTGPSRLEWYKSLEKFTATKRSAGKAALFGSSKQGVIYLRCCLGVSRTGSSRRGHTVALYVKDQTIVMVVEDQQEQEEWYTAIKKLMEEERRDEEHGEGFDEDDDGYCTLPPAAFFKEVWPVSVKPTGLGRSKSLTGESRLCLTAASLVLVRVGSCTYLPSVTIPLLSVRRFGHLDGMFFLELGRSAPDGPGEIWMEARDQGIAQNIHEVVRETVRSLRALPDFSQSPTSNPYQPQASLVSKRCRPKYRDKLLNVRLPPRNNDIQTSPTRSHPEPCRPDNTKPESPLSFSSHLSPARSQQSSRPETDSYMEMKTKHCSVAACRMVGWETGEQEEEEEEEEEEEGLGYMMMSPQGSHSSSVLPQGDYVTMATQQKHHWPLSSSPSSGLHSSFNSSTSDSYSPVHPSHYQISEHSPPHWQLTSVHQSEMEASQSLTSISPSTGPQQHRRQPAETGAASSPVRSVGGSYPMTRPVQVDPNCGTGRSTRLQAEPDRSAVRRCRLSSCLLSCLQTDPD
ncbi:insulin receptor substrate 2-B-like isoform X2 [Scophthalmus maximus]|uniref:insulin receptor substrate 2-B-like isoform X2 n=1 Tax=Scophthalmus maximus TaxID=52904 RepID=UPI0015E091A9|nr:insulin receptor substrate 2-B-like isoform X2 [Scophthalmus maximus]